MLISGAKNIISQRRIVMFKQSLLDKLITLRLPGVHEALSSQMGNTQYSELSFEERLNLLLDHELLLRTERRLTRKLKQANFKETMLLGRKSNGAAMRIWRQVPGRKWHLLIHSIDRGTTCINKMSGFKMSCPFKNI